jgi:hypothetical protein
MANRPSKSFVTLKKDFYGRTVAGRESWPNHNIGHRLSRKAPWRGLQPLPMCPLLSAGMESHRFHILKRRSWLGCRHLADANGTR